MRETLRALRDVLANPALRRLQVAWAASMTGTLAYLVVLSVVAYRHGGGATGVGLLMLLRMIVSAAASPFTAILADRRSRRGVMVGTDLVRAVLVLSLAWLVSAGVAAVFAMACVIAVVATAFRPAQASLLPQLARTPEELTAANAVAVTIESAAIFAGPGIGGLLLALTRTSVVFAICAAIFVWSAALIALVPDPERPAPSGASEAGGLLRTAGEGFRVLLGTPLLATVVGVYALQAAAAGALGVYTVVLALAQLHIGNAGVGYLDSAFGVGGILGGVGAAALAAGRRLAVAFADRGTGVGAASPWSCVAVSSRRSRSRSSCSSWSASVTPSSMSPATRCSSARRPPVRRRVFGVAPRP